MASVLTPKRKKFADAYLETGNGTQAALVSFDVTSEETAASVASRALRSVKVQEYLHSKAEDAATMIYSLSQKSKQDFIRLNASKDILDRSGHSAVRKSELKSLNVNVESRLEDKSELEDIRQRFITEMKSKLSDGTQ